MAARPITDTLGFLLGTWDVDRRIDDRRHGCEGRFVGTATLRTVTGAAPAARYREEGELRYGSHAGPATRCLDYVRRGDLTVAVSFTDGRPFVDIDLRTGAWRGRHPCGCDHYEMATTVVADDVVEEWWRVTGPEKDYEAVTVLVRRGRRG
jgi:hypothetical protein